MSLYPTEAWAETSPAGSDQINAGDNRIRQMKTQIREIIGVDHDFPSSGQAADNGQHLRVTLQEQADLGTGAVGTTLLGNQTVSGKGELVYTDEDDNDIQITSGGNIDGASVRLDNNESLTATDNAGTGTVALIKANASDQAEITPAALATGGVILPEISAPTTAANQGGLYTKNDGSQTELYFREESNGDEVQITKAGSLNVATSLGSWVDKSSSYDSQQATTDGFVTAFCSATASGAFDVQGYSDSASTPTTLRAWSRITAVGSNSVAITMPVKKGDYWRVVTSSITPTIVVYWIPLGS